MACSIPFCEKPAWRQICHPLCLDHTARALSVNCRKRLVDLRCPICRAEPTQSWQSVGEILRELPTRATIIGAHGKEEPNGPRHLVGYERCPCEDEGCPYGSIQMVPFCPTASLVQVSAFTINGTTPTFEAAPSKSKVRRLRKRRAKEQEQERATAVEGVTS